MIHPEYPRTFGLPYLKLPLFGGTTGGWLRVAETEEKYVITWESKEEQIFEMPTSGVAKMQIGLNIVYFSKKEQCLALGTQLRTLFKISNYKVFRIFANTGMVQYLHPKDGVFPEKLNTGRIGIGNVGHSIGKNPQPVSVKFKGRNTYD